MLQWRSGRIINLTRGGTGTPFPLFAIDPGLVRTAMTEFQLTDPAGRTYLGNIKELFARGIDVPPSLGGGLTASVPQWHLRADRYY